MGHLPDVCSASSVPVLGMSQEHDDVTGKKKKGKKERQNEGKGKKKTQPLISKQHLNLSSRLDHSCRRAGEVGSLWQAQQLPLLQAGCLEEIPQGPPSYCFSTDHKAKPYEDVFHLLQSAFPHLSISLHPRETEVMHDPAADCFLLSSRSKRLQGQHAVGWGKKSPLLKPVPPSIWGEANRGSPKACAASKKLSAQHSKREGCLGDRLQQKSLFGSIRQYSKQVMSLRRGKIYFRALSSSVWVLISGRCCSPCREVSVACISKRANCLNLAVSLK